MKFNYALFIIFFIWLPGGVLIAQDSTGLPGDNFSLEGALELFKKSESPEAFEKMLNAENSKVNNLDLNGDGETDYIRVIDKQDGDDHAFILQSAISENENQDVAVIEVEKNKDGEADVQIVGDEDLYGKETIIEPHEEVKSNAGATVTNVNVNVWSWPAVRYVYGPSYRVWISPWGWSARPIWWRPWRPVRYHVFYPYRAPYRHRYVVVNVHRTVRAHRIYAPVRTTSVIVHTRHHVAVDRYRSSIHAGTPASTHHGRQVSPARKTSASHAGRGTRTGKRSSRSRAGNK
jgi:hypothetical protein